MRKDIDSKLQYIRSLYAKDDDLLLSVKQKITESDLAINIGAEEAKFLQFLIKLANVKTIIEIGTHFGYSAIWMARALPFDGKIITIEYDKKRAQQAELHFAASDVANKISLIVGDAKEVLADINGEHDMIFIDANKSGYPLYLERAKILLRTGGLLVADNCLLSGEVYEGHSHFSLKQVTMMQNFNNELANEKQFFSVMIPSQDGLSVAIKL